MARIFDDSTAKTVTFSGFSNSDFTPINDTSYVNTLVLPDSATTEKIRIEDDVTAHLDPDFFQESSSREAHGLDTNKLEIIFSPDNSFLERAAKYFGDFNIDDYIGDPREQSQPAYRTLESFLRNQWNVYLEKANINDFVNLFKLYDRGLFDQLVQLCPARVDCNTGFVVGDSKIKRNKSIKTKPAGLASSYEGNISGSLYGEPVATVSKITGSFEESTIEEPSYDIQAKYTAIFTSEFSKIAARIVGLNASTGKAQNTTGTIDVTDDLDIPPVLEAIVLIDTQRDNGTDMERILHEGTQMAAPGVNLPTPFTVDKKSVVEVRFTG